MYTTGAIYDMSDQTEDAQKAYKKAKEHGLQQLFTSLTPQLLLPSSTSHSTTTTTTHMPYTYTNTIATNTNNNSNNNTSMKRPAPV